MTICNKANTPSLTDPSSVHYSAIVDANGREVPITQQMIQRACENLESWSMDYGRQIRPLTAN